MEDSAHRPASLGRVVAIVLAGGRGERLRPLTDECPKPLVEVGGRPLVGYALDRLAAAGVTDVLLSTAYRSAQFPAVLGDGSAYGVRLRFSVENPPLGTGGALGLAWRVINRSDGPPPDAVVVLNADQLSGHDLSAQLRQFDRDRPEGLLHVRFAHDRRTFGAVEVDAAGRVTAFREKPAGAGPGLVNVGCYVFHPSLIRQVADHNGPVSLERELLPGWIAGGRAIDAFRDDAFGLDVGTPAALAEAHRHLGNGADR